MKIIISGLFILLLGTVSPIYSASSQEKSDEKKLVEALSELHELLFGKIVEVSTGYSMIEENPWKKLAIAIPYHLESVQKKVAEKLPDCKTVTINTSFTFNTSNSPAQINLTSLIGCLDKFSPSQ